jgi:hypothetical protein
MWASRHNGDLRRTAHGYEATREAAMAAFAKSRRGMIARDGKADELAQTFAPALACALAVLDCRGWRVRLETRARAIVFAVRLRDRVLARKAEREVVGSLNLELVKRYVAYVLLPPLITLALGLLGAWVVSSFERKGA